MSCLLRKIFICHPAPQLQFGGTGSSRKKEVWATRLQDFTASWPLVVHRHSRNARLMLRYSAYIDSGYSIFYNTCISFVSAILAQHRIGTSGRKYRNSDNLFFPGCNGLGVIYWLLFPRWNFPFLLLKSPLFLLSVTWWCKKQTAKKICFHFIKLSVFNLDKTFFTSFRLDCNSTS